jgi:hypothetical protein
MQSAAGLLVALHGPALSDTALLGAAAILVAASALYARSMFTVSHAAVYRQAVRQLSTSPAVLEVRHGRHTRRGVCVLGARCS